MLNDVLGDTLSKAQRNLNSLRDNEWLTPETRAVIIEFVIYNANTNLFAASSMTFEFLPTGCKFMNYSTSCPLAVSL